MRELKIDIYVFQFIRSTCLTQKCCQYINFYALDPASSVGTDIKGPDPTRAHAGEYEMYC
jgi:hypothetical protein